MPLYQKEIFSDKLLLGIWKIEESEEYFQQMLLSEEFVDACSSISSHERRIERCAVRLLLRIMTGKYLKIYYSEEGKPYFQENNLKVSISHAKGFAAIALHPSNEIGIDIERPSSRIIKVRERVFSASEISMVSFVDKRKEELYSTVYWCAKETVFKIVGNAVSDYRHTIFIPPFHLEGEGAFLVKMPYYNKVSSLTVSYRIYEDFILAWSVKS